jgi:predicted aldo/keto reductase-like oxidoreductase
MSDRSDSKSGSQGKRLTRRRFLGSAVGAAATVAGGLGAAASAGAREVRRDPSAAYDEKLAQAGATGKPAPLPKRTLGRTGIKVTALSMGGIGTNTDVLRAGLDAGINFIHCAMGYGTLAATAEAIAGRRNQLFLGLKYERAGAVDWDYLNRALRALGVDYVDVLFFPLNSPEQARNRAHLDFFTEVKKQKKARFIGITSHSNIPPTLQAAVEAGFWDVLMPSYVPALPERQALRPVLDQAEKKKLGVVAMKTIGGVRPDATRQMRAIIKEVLADSSVTTVCKGMTSYELLDTCLGAVAGPPKGTRSASLREHLAAQQGQVCFLCGSCASCPRGVNCFDVVRAFDYYREHAGPEVARRMYALIPAHERGNACDDCGECDGKCPYGVNIARHVRAAHLMLG